MKKKKMPSLRSKGGGFKKPATYTDFGLRSSASRRRKK